MKAGSRYTRLRGIDSGLRPTLFLVNSRRPYRNWTNAGGLQGKGQDWKLSL